MTRSKKRREKCQYSLSKAGKKGRGRKGGKGRGNFLSRELKLEQTVQQTAYSHAGQKELKNRGEGISEIPEKKKKNVNDPG